MPLFAQLLSVETIAFYEFTPRGAMSKGKGVVDCHFSLLSMLTKVHDIVHWAEWDYYKLEMIRPKIIIYLLTNEEGQHT